MINFSDKESGKKTEPQAPKSNELEDTDAEGAENDEVEEACSKVDEEAKTSEKESQ